MLCSCLNDTGVYGRRPSPGPVVPQVPQGLVVPQGPQFLLKVYPAWDEKHLRKFNVKEAAPLNSLCQKLAMAFDIPETKLKSGAYFLSPKNDRARKIVELQLSESSTVQECTRPS